MRTTITITISILLEQYSWNYYIYQIAHFHISINKLLFWNQIIILIFPEYYSFSKEFELSKIIYTYEFYYVRRNAWFIRTTSSITMLLDLLTLSIYWFFLSKEFKTESLFIYNIIYKTLNGYCYFMIYFYYLYCKYIHNGCLN